VYRRTLWWNYKYKIVKFHVMYVRNTVALLPNRMEVAGSAKLLTPRARRRAWYETSMSIYYMLFLHWFSDVPDVECKDSEKWGRRARPA
jgi:hypothetical protein